MGLAKGANCSVCGDHKIRCTRLFRCDVCEQYCCIPCHSEAAALRKGEAPRVRRGRRQGQKGQKGQEGGFIVGDLTNPNVVPMGQGMVVSSGTSVTAGHHFGDLNVVWEQLERLPTVFDITSLKHCPRSLSRRFSMLGGRLLSESVRLNGADPFVRKVVNRLLYVLPWLLLRNPAVVGAAEPQQNEIFIKAAIKGEVAKRLHLAEQNQWSHLVGQAATD